MVLLTICCALILLLAIEVVILIFTILIYKNTNIKNPQKHFQDELKIDSPEEVGIVFCRNCGNQYDSIETICPKCKTPR